MVIRFSGVSGRRWP